MRKRIKQKESTAYWHDYFVWFPTVIRDFDTKQRFWVCLETIRRKKTRGGSGHVYWQYRFKDKEYAE